MTEQQLKQALGAAYDQGYAAGLAEAKKQAEKESPLFPRSFADSTSFNVGKMTGNEMPLPHRAEVKGEKKDQKAKGDSTEEPLMPR